MLKFFSKRRAPSIISLLAFLFVAQHVVLSLCWAEPAIKVGVFQNKPIVYYDEEGPKGLFVEVIDHVNLNSSRSDKETIHLALEFEDGAPAYEPGDSLEID